MFKKMQAVAKALPSFYIPIALVVFFVALCAHFVLQSYHYKHTILKLRQTETPADRSLVKMYSVDCLKHSDDTVRKEVARKVEIFTQGIDSLLVLVYCEPNYKEVPMCEKESFYCFSTRAMRTNWRRIGVMHRVNKKAPTGSRI